MIPVLPLLLAVTPQSPAAPDHASWHADWHPAGADLYLLAPDVHAWIRAATQSPLARLVQDPRVASSLEDLGGVGFELSDLGEDPTAVVEPLFDTLDLPEELRVLIREAISDLDSASLSLAGVGDTARVPEQILAHLRQVERDFADVEHALDEHAWSGDGTYPAELAEVDLGASVFVDPWGRSYRFERVDGGRGYVVTSFGADGEEGGRLLGADLHLRMEPGGFWAESDVGTTQAALVASALNAQAVFGFRTEERAVEVFDSLAGSAQLQLDPAADRTHAQLRSIDVEGRPLPARVLGVPDAPLPYLVAVRSGSELSLTLGADPDAQLAGLSDRLGSHASSLSDAPGYQLGLRSAGGRSSSSASDAEPGEADTVFVSYRSMPLLQLVGQGAELAARLSGDEEGLEELLAVLELATGEGPRATYSRYSFRDGLYRITSFEQMPDEPVGLARFLGRAPVELDPEAPIPSESMLVYSTSLDGEELRDALLGLIADQGGASAQDWRAALEEGYDCKLEDLFSQLGGTLLVVSDRVRGVAVPRAYGFVDLADPDAFWGSFEGFARFLADTFPEEIQLGTRPYKKVPLVTFKLESLGGFVQPSFCTLDGKLIVSLTSSNLKKEIKRRLTGESDRRSTRSRAGADQGAAAEDEPHAILGTTYSIPEGARSIYYMDWGSALGGLYSTVRMFASMAEGLAEVPFDLEALPPPEIFTENLLPGFHTTRRVDGGILLEGHSSFGPEVSFGLVAGVSLGLTTAVDAGAAPMAEAGGAGGIFVTPTGPQEDAVPVPGHDVDAHTRTRVAFGALRTALAIHRIEFGGYPAVLGALVEPSDAYPAGLLEGGVLPLDGWGNGLRYELSEDGKSYTLWSVGPDGVDDGGAGDDVSAQ